jgi:hypothetical protein
MTRRRDVIMLLGGYGKPPQLNTADAGQFRRARDLSDDELVAIIDRALPAPTAVGCCATCWLPRGARLAVGMSRR